MRGVEEICEGAQSKAWKLFCNCSEKTVKTSLFLKCYIHV